MKHFYVAFIILISFLSQDVQAQYADFKSGLMIRKTFYDYNTSRNKDAVAFINFQNGFDIAYLRNLSQNISLVFPFGIGIFKDTIENVKTAFFTFGAQAQLHLFKTNRWANPFFTTGVQAVFPKGKDFALELPVGLGIQFMVHPQVYLHWQSDYRVNIAKWEDHIQHHFGFIYLFGNIVHKKDSIPPAIKKMDSLIVAKPDSDHDGIIDEIDLCPNTPGLAVYAGCPDTDGDGVEDAKDKCPDIKGKIEFHGCPDTDEDGVPDNEDECPNIKGTIANKGCPEAEAETKKMDEKVEPKAKTKVEEKVVEKVETKEKPKVEEKVEEKMEIKAKPKAEEKKAEKVDKKAEVKKAENKKAQEKAETKKVEEKVKVKPKEELDSDGDGVPDKDDYCPDKAGLKEMNGCPDSDGDGVSDIDDKCPTVPGLKSNAGCPEPAKKEKDSDNDGIPDDKDECPFTAGLPAMNGCPDTDGDGVMDKVDNCPTVPGPASNKGCPVIEKSDRETLDFAMRAVQFESGRATLKSESFYILDKVAKLLKRYPDYNLNIEGHTDNTGSLKLNMDLSERRAKVCYEYLISQGVPTSKLHYSGYGPTKPISSNSNEVGRFLNRRVEFNLVPR